MANILYFGDDAPGSTSAHRALALRRLGHSLELYNPARGVSGLLGIALLGPFHYRSGYRLLQPPLQKWLRQILKAVNKPDLIWINSGELLGPGCLKLLKEVGCPIVLYNSDDPTGKRDGRRFDLLLQALPLYDLCVVRRELKVEEYRAKGAKKVLMVRLSYDEVAHQPFARVSDIPEVFRSELAFVGTWIRHEKRDEFMLELMRQGVPLSIWGGRWQKSPQWKSLQHVYRGDALSGREYVAAMQGAKICLGLLSKGNRNLHTSRSVEIPFAGGLLCAERTTEHMEMYQEGEEAVFWSDAAECAELCKKLLADKDRQERIRQGGMRRVRNLGVGNEDVCRTILNAVFSPEKAGISTSKILV